MEESLILSQFDALVKSGLVQYDDQRESIEHFDGEYLCLLYISIFQFLLTSALTKEPTIQTSQQQIVKNGKQHYQGRDGSDINTRGFEIGNISNTHFIAANKFCFARPHLLLLTSDGYQKQYEPLRQIDLEAAWTMLTTVGKEYVVFYNGGQDGGCSRLHKHMQLMPMPEDSFTAFLDSESGKEPRIYAYLLKQASKVRDNQSEHADDASLGAGCPHNMILTKRWMLVLPRRRGAIAKEAEVNSIGMLGVIAVATKEGINTWLRQGLTQTLRELGVLKEI
ncbi:hypothetical protein F5884DRAFT_821113 [Xylogone sp. PMI_703]|nr:hypothetical protein F5884DRAFT_821113 [Xylogone sp. PMI_703]